MECPRCRLVRPPGTERCDCGFDFVQELEEIKKKERAWPTLARSLERRLAEDERRAILRGSWPARLRDVFRRESPKERLKTAAERYITRLDKETQAEYSDAIAAVASGKREAASVATRIYSDVFAGARPRRSRRPSGWRERAFEFLHGSPEHEFFAAMRREVRDFDPAAWIAQYDEALRKGPRTRNLAEVASTLRAKHGWPERGPVLAYPNADEAINDALMTIERYGGEVPVEEVVSIVATLRPEGAQSFFMNRVLATLDPEGSQASRLETRASSPSTAKSPIWSQHPGCFERHLQRRHGSPLFPSSRRHVSAAEIRVAREKDAAEIAALQNDYAAVREEIATLPESVTAQAAVDLAGRALGVAERAAAIGRSAQAMLRVASEAHRLLLKSAGESPEGLAETEEAKRHYLNPLLAQLRRADSPIREEELAATMLAEGPRELAELLAAFPDDLSDMLRAKALRLLDYAERHDIFVPAAKEARIVLTT